MSYPRPDRSDYTPNRRKTPENEALDIGWDEGVLRDGRPFRAECWAEDGVTHLTFFFSTHGLETASNTDLAALLLDADLIRFRGDRRYVAARPWTDAAGNDMWSVNVVVGDEDEMYVSDHLRLRQYAHV